MRAVTPTSFRFDLPAARRQAALAGQMRRLTALVKEDDRAGVEVQRAHRDREDLVDAAREPWSPADRGDHAVQQGQTAGIVKLRLCASTRHVPPKQSSSAQYSRRSPPAWPERG